MKEDFVTYDIAVKLKKKGFNDECHAYYEPLKHCLNISRVFKTNSLAENYNCIAAPTVSQVLKWLREEKKIFILIDIRIDLSWFYEVWGFEISLLPLGYVPYQKKQSYEQAALAGIEYVIDNLI